MVRGLKAAALLWPVVLPCCQDGSIPAQPLPYHASPHSWRRRLTSQWDTSPLGRSSLCYDLEENQGAPWIPPPFLEAIPREMACSLHWHSSPQQGSHIHHSLLVVMRWGLLLPAAFRVVRKAPFQAGPLVSWNTFQSHFH